MGEVGDPPGSVKSVMNNTGYKFLAPMENKLTYNMHGCAWKKCHQQLNN